MGVQIHIQTNNLLKLGCRVEFSSLCYDEDGEKFYTITAHVTFPNGKDFYMSATDQFDSLWADFNDWGENKPIIAPLIKMFEVPHILG